MAEKGALRGGALRTAQRRATQRREVEGRLGRAEKRVLRGAGGLRGGARALSATPPDAPSAPVPGGAGSRPLAEDARAAPPRPPRSHPLRSRGPGGRPRRPSSRAYLGRRARSRPPGPDPLSRGTASGRG